MEVTTTDSAEMVGLGWNQSYQENAILYYEDNEVFSLFPVIFHMPSTLELNRKCGSKPADG